MRFSIITTVLNGAGTIRDCLESVRGQSLPAEHIVIDGGSIDGTREVVKRHAGTSGRMVSGPDRGMYDGLNKGIGLASGGVVGLLHADDLYSHDHVLRKVAEVFEDPRVDACYGDLVYVDAVDTGRVIRYWRSGGFKPKSFLCGWMPPHPTFFVRRRCYEKYGGFRLDMGSAADYELMLRFLFRYGLRAAYIPDVLVRMRIGGKSNRSLVNRLRAHGNDWRAWRVNGLMPYPWTLLAKPIRKIGQYFNKQKQ